MRDPIGNTQAYEIALAEASNVKARVFDEFDTLAIKAKVSIATAASYRYTSLVACQYASGMPLPEIQAELAIMLPRLTQLEEFARAEGPAVKPNWPAMKTFRGVFGSVRVSFSFAGLALLLLETEEQVQQWSGLLAREPEYRSYLLDLLTKSFAPQHKLAAKYKADRITEPFTQPVLRVLACAPADRPAAMAAYMKSWTRVMRPYGLTPNLDTRPGHDKLFADFAYEVALAVCAYDIDDSAFADHPYYPRELVQHYRSELRHTRDAWRPQGQGAGVEIIAPPPPKKADLAKSKRKAIARWVELACDGDDNAVASVLEVIGKPRKIDELDELMQTLAECRHGIHADIKDDESVAAQAFAFFGARGLGDLDIPPGPPFGPARCSQILSGLAAQAKSHGYQVLDLDNGDDAWHVVAVKSAFYDEFLALTTALGIRSRTPEVAYS
jgi:hypothetical protein